MITIKINEENVKKRLDTFITEYLENGYTRAKIGSFIEKENVFVNNKAQKPSYKLKLNDIISFDENILEDFFKIKPLQPFNFKLDIKFEDDDIIVVNKPKQMLTHPTAYENENTLCNALLYHCKTLSDVGGKDRPGIVHRLDKNTAGLIIAAKNNNAHKVLAEQIREKKAKRKYLALALGEFCEKEGIINKPLVHYIKNNVKMEIAQENEGLEAITLYKVLHQFKGCALVELELMTGRTHQIRAHLSSINHPVFGDELYGSKQFQRGEFNNIKTTDQLLQSYYLSFYHPITNNKMEFQLEEKDFSKDFIKVLNFLRSKE